MKELVFLLEEASAAALLEKFLPRILQDEITPRMLVFEGKQDLADSVARKIRGYRNEQARFLILADQDRTADCRSVKRRFVEECTRSGRAEHCLVRIACREMETFYLADLDAVSRALEIPVVAKHQNKSKFRRPDELTGPSMILEDLTEKRYRKVSSSRRIGEFLDPENVRSGSFRNFVAAIRRLQDELLALNG